MEARERLRDAGQGVFKGSERSSFRDGKGQVVFKGSERNSFRKGKGCWSRRVLG